MQLIHRNSLYRTSFERRFEVCYNSDMDTKLIKFFNKHHIEIPEIKYIKRENGKTNIFLVDGRIIDTFTPLKAILDELPVQEFLNINKGIAISTSKIYSVKDDLYTMEDGMVFKGRARLPRTVKYEQEKKYNKSKNRQALSIDYQCSIFDHYPLPFLLIGMEYNGNGSGMNGVIHYINDAFLERTEYTQQELLNQPLSSFSIPTKIMIAIADTALNGGQKWIQAPLIEEEVLCYQPREDFCALVAAKKRSE